MTQENFLANLNGVQVLKLLFGHIQVLQGFAIAVPKVNDVADDFAILDFSKDISLHLEPFLSETMDVKFVVSALSLACVGRVHSACLRGGVGITSPSTLTVAVDPAARREVAFSTAFNVMARADDQLCSAFE
jgi:hypothetical protein